MKKIKNIRIVDKKRFTAFCIAVVIVLSGFLAAACSGIGSAEAAQEQYTTIYVGSGDTLWNIVGEIYPRNTDKRAVIDKIKQVNGMTTSTIYPGEMLYIPVY